MRFLTAGESHGSHAVTIIEGFPANVPINKGNLINLLRGRRTALGRGGRMQLEGDDFQVLSGMRAGFTLGSPITLAVENVEWGEKWSRDMNPWEKGDLDPVRVPRPGHADLPGSFKYQQQDLRNIWERASARETVVRTLVGGFAMELLRGLDITVQGKVVEIGGSEQLEDVIHQAKEKGITLGGIVQVRITGVSGGIGSHMHWDRRLDTKFAGALMSIQGVKGVEIGPAFSSAGLPGSDYHDEFVCDQGSFSRKTNRAGGIEGGMTNGQEIILGIMVKPIPTMTNPLGSFDLKTKEITQAPVFRHDTTAVDAARVVAEAVCAWELGAMLVEQMGASTWSDLKERYSTFHNRWKEAIKCR